MVNKALLGLSVVVLVAVFGIGVFTGMQLGGGGLSTAAEPATGGTPTAGDGSSADASTPTATPAATATPEDVRENISAASFDQANISSYIAQYLNDARADEGLDPLSTSGTIAERVGRMSQNHSEEMAEADTLAHTLYGVTSEDRYDRNDLTDVCSFNVTETPSGNELEAIGRTVAGRPYTDDGQEQFNDEDADVARAVIGDILAVDRYEERLMQPRAGRIGVGVGITPDGDVYVTLNTCA